jgi:hypothetical protein
MSNDRGIPKGRVVTGLMKRAIFLKLPSPLPLSQKGEGFVFSFLTQGGATESLTLGYNHLAPSGQ